MPAFFSSDWAASCHSRPSASSWWYGSSPRQVSNTFLTWGESQASLPAIRSTWNW